MKTCLTKCLMSKKMSLFGLFINMSKSKSLLFKKSRDRKSYDLNGVQSVCELSILGVIINDRLSKNSHIDKVLSNANQRLYLMRILKQLLSIDDSGTFSQKFTSYFCAAF